MNNAQRLAFATAFATVVLIALGALVRATGSGLGCPDWPTCHGGVVPPGSKAPIIEYLHRFVASAVGLLVIATAVMAWRHYRHVRFVVWASVIAVPLVMIQGVLGAITVWWELPPEIVATHLLTAMLVLTFELAVAIAMYAEDPAHRQAFVDLARDRVRPIGIAAVAAIAWLSLMVWVGGFLPESGSSAACAAWPTCNGYGVLPTGHQEFWHMLHRYLSAAFLFFVAPVLWVMWQRRREFAWAGPRAVALGVLFVAQVAIGAFNVWYTFPKWLTISHTAVASLVWCTLSSVVLLSFYVPVEERAAMPRRTAEAPA